jgi:hypothetical protein
MNRLLVFCKLVSIDFEDHKYINFAQCCFTAKLPWTIAKKAPLWKFNGMDRLLLF